MTSDLSTSLERCTHLGERGLLSLIVWYCTVVEVKCCSDREHQQNGSSVISAPQEVREKEHHRRKRAVKRRGRVGRGKTWSKEVRGNEKGCKTRQEGSEVEMVWVEGGMKGVCEDWCEERRKCRGVLVRGGRGEARVRLWMRMGGRNVMNVDMNEEGCEEWRVCGREWRRVWAEDGRSAM